MVWGETVKPFKVLQPKTGEVQKPPRDVRGDKAL
jgi:hypothetical protein